MQRLPEGNIGQEKDWNMETGLMLQHGHPDDRKGRKETELAVYDLLDFLQIDYDRVDRACLYNGGM